VWAAHVVSVLGLDVTFDSTRDAAGWILAVGGALALVGRGIVIPVVRWARRLESVMAAVEEQLYPDSGFSLRDAVTQIQDRLGIEPKVPTRAVARSRDRSTPKRKRATP